MSGLAACWHLSGRPAGVELDRMLDAAGGRGRDGRAIWREGSVGLGQLHLGTSPGPPGRPQLVRDDDRDVVVAVHGRVHGPAGPVAEVVLRAYRRFGPDFQRHVAGDLATVIWDGRARRLLALCDHHGIRPLVWWTDGRLVLVASETSQLVAHGAFNPEVDEAVLAESYANRLLTVGETLLQDVRRVAAGEVVEFGERGHVARRRWTTSPVARPAHRRTSDWVAEYRETFVQAVRSAADTARPPALMVSGGLDSSSVLCAAAHDGCVTDNWDLLTYDIDHSGADDPAYTRDISAATGATIHRLPVAPYDWRRTIDVVQRRFSLPMRPNAALHRLVVDRAVAAGRSVIITGEGGDDWLTALPRFWPDHLMRGHLGSVARAAWAQSTSPPARRALGTAKRIAHQGVLPLMGRLTGRPRPPMTEVPGWIRPVFARRVDLDARLAAWSGSEPRGPVYPARWAELHGGLEMESANAGVEYRHPFHDRRLVELTFALPEDIVCRDGVRKWVLREAMTGILPPTILRRRDKGHFTPFLARGIDEVLGCLGGIPGLHRLIGVQRGYLDMEGLTELATRSLACLREERFPETNAENPTNLWAVLSTDIWLAVRSGLPPPVPVHGEATPVASMMKGVRTCDTSSRTR